MWTPILEHALSWAPTIITIASCVLVIAMVRFLRKRRKRDAPNLNPGIVGPLITFAMVGISFVLVILSLPVGDAARGELLSLLGLLVTATIALSSTTILGNAMAGIMLRAIRHFRPGDYVRVGEHIGRVSDLGFLHTEIQTEDRDLTTLPNLFLVSHPLTVLHQGTVVSATISLGYEVSHSTVETHLKSAAERAGLIDPFVQVLELGDFSITYRAAGFLVEIKHLLTTRSNLRKAMLDTLHEANIEIVSPTFMNQRQLQPSDVFVPKLQRPLSTVTEVAPEATIFDKADAAEAKVKMIAELTSNKQEIAELSEQLANVQEGPEQMALQEKLERAQERMKTLTELLTE